MQAHEPNLGIQNALARAECQNATAEDVLLLSEALRTALQDNADLHRERDRAVEEAARCLKETARVTAKAELLKEAVLRALECLMAPNPYADPNEQDRAIVGLEEALAVNGYQVLRFKITSDKN